MSSPRYLNDLGSVFDGDTGSGFVSGSRIIDPFYSKKDSGAGVRIRLRPSEFIQRFIRIKNADTKQIEPIDLRERQYLIRPYDTDARKMLLLTSRQTEKSTTLGNKLMQRCCMKPLHTALFFTPSAMQTTVFSRARLADIIDISPLMKGLTSLKLTNNILEREFINRSKIYLRYVFLTADRARGLSVNDIFGDEIQDVITDNLGVIEEAASHHKDAFFCYSGTPKTLDNTINRLWERSSTQSEWVIPCDRHGTPKDPGSWHWNILGEKNIGKRGPVCDRCFKPLNPEHKFARWVQMNTSTKAEFEGFRICRLMVPWVYKTEKMWNEVLTAQERYPRPTFMNEVLAISYDSGTKPISRLELIQACDDKYKMDEDAVAELAKSCPSYIGIDWGSAENTYTVMSVLMYCRDDHSLQVVYSRRFDGPDADPKVQLREIKRLSTKFNFKFIGADYGMGFVQNHDLITTFGPQRVHAFQYAARAPNKFNWSPKLRRYIVYRTPVMSDIFGALKRRKIRLPSWNVYERPYGEDISSIFQEYSETLRMLKYDTGRSRPDDTFHSILFGTLVSMLDVKRPDIIRPMKETQAERTQSLVERGLHESFDAFDPNEPY